MQIVINIGDKQYNDIIAHYNTFPSEWKKWGLQAIKNGVPLPKGHGDLIDRDKLDCDSDWNDWTDDFMAVSWSQINNAEVIIEADEVEE